MVPLAYMLVIRPDKEMGERMSDMLREFCAENLVNVEEALDAGARRIELCDDLSVGGITPTEDVMRQAVELAHAYEAPVMVMVRPRGGDFAYSEDELKQMERAIRMARVLGADGVVFGCVSDGELDEDALNMLVRAATGLDMTFHMAFDEISPSCQAAALDTLATMGFSRVLTHGGSLSLPLDDCMAHLQELVEAAGTAIAIMPGGGVTWENAEHVCNELGVREVHGTRIVAMPVGSEN